MKKIIFFINTVILMCLISCESQVESDINKLLMGHIKIEVTDFGFTNIEQPTKTSEIGYQTKFEKGDIVGVYIINTQSSQDNKENIPLTFDGVSWNFPSNVTISNINNIQLFAYYPYDGSMSLVKPSVSDGMAAEDFFADYILKQTLVGNQAEYEDYTKADIMVGKGSLYGSILKFEMKHQMSLMVIKLPNEVTYAKEYYLTTDPDYKWQRFKRSKPASLSNIQFTGFTPYEVRAGEYRYIVPSSHTFASNVSGSFEVNGESRQYSFTPQGLNKNEYKEYKITATIIEETIAHTLAIGDIYKSDGGLISQAELANPGITEEEKTECVGIVFQTYYKGDGSTKELTGRIGDVEIQKLKEVTDNPSYLPHGMVWALKHVKNNENVYDYYKWRLMDKIVNDLKELNTKESILADISGLSNCSIVKSSDGYDKNEFPAFKAAFDYNIYCPLKKETTGWYLPSIGQLSDILKNLAGFDYTREDVISRYHTNGGLYIFFDNQSEQAAQNVNKFFDNFSDGYVDKLKVDLVSKNERFISSSMSVYPYPRYIDFWIDGKLHIHCYFKMSDIQVGKVRCVLTF